jgi:hypothetical protein
VRRCLGSPGFAVGWDSSTSGACCRSREAARTGDHGATQFPTVLKSGCQAPHAGLNTESSHEVIAPAAANVATAGPVPGPEDQFAAAVEELWGMLSGGSEPQRTVRLPHPHPDQPLIVCTRGRSRARWSLRYGSVRGVPARAFTVAAVAEDACSRQGRSWRVRDAKSRDEVSPARGTGRFGVVRADARDRPAGFRNEVCANRERVQKRRADAHGAAGNPGQWRLHVTAVDHKSQSAAASWPPGRARTMPALAQAPPLMRKASNRETSIPTSRIPPRQSRSSDRRPRISPEACASESHKPRAGSGMRADVTAWADHGQSPHLARTINRSPT